MDNNKETNNEKEQDSPDLEIIEEKITKANGEIVIKKYSRGRALGKGGFAKCYEITNIENKKTLAAKIIAKSSLNRSRAKQKLISEIKIHKSLNHLHIVKFEHVFEDSENVYILLQICTNHTLNELIKRRKRLTQMEAQYYLSQICSALKYLHQNKVIHRDLKLGNLFLNENMEIKLGDFGLAARLEYEDQKKKTICGTPNYIAPEILEGKGHSYEVDVWSVGVILYTLIIGKPPFQTNEVKTTYKKIKMCQYSFPEHYTVSANAKLLITKILNLDPSKRPNLEQILADPFMTSDPIPKTLPISTLICLPQKNFVQQFTKSISNKASTKIQLQSKNQKQKPVFTENQSNPKQAKVNEQFASSTKNLKSQRHEFRNNRNVVITNLFKNTQNLPKNQNDIVKCQNVKKFTHSEIHVKKWVDYSTKYGLGYLISDGSTGVYYNDSTKIIVDKDGENFQYIQKKPGDKFQSVYQYQISDYPQQKQLQKKVTLLQHFQNYLSSGDKIVYENQVQKDSQLVYVKKWMKTKHAIMFRLSNKIVQVNFTDKTEIILSSQQKMVTYINVKGEKSEYPLATALDSRNSEMAKRLKYTKQILTHMLNGTSVPQSNIQDKQDFVKSSKNLKRE